jgi:hypothetical protein
VGGDGALLSRLACACKVGIDPDPEKRRRSITAFGIDCVPGWNDLPQGCADVIAAWDPETILSADTDWRSARLKLKPDGRILFVASGPEAEAGLASRLAAAGFAAPRRIGGDVSGNALFEAGMMPA